VKKLKMIGSGLLGSTLPMLAAAPTDADGLITGATTTFASLVTFLLVVGVFAIAYRLVRKYTSKA